MEQNTQVFYGKYAQAESPENDGFLPRQEYGDNGYEEEGYAVEDYEGDEGAYGDGMEDVNGQNADAEAFFDDEDDSIYSVEQDGTRRFHMAMNVFDTTSVLAGVVVILALTALIVSLVTWLRTDITHSFVLLQSGIQ